MFSGPKRRVFALSGRYLVRQIRNQSQAERVTRRPRRGTTNVPARTRFAPSPTGFLHLGSLRTALFNYLLAKSTGGQFLLRLEDTDQTRIVAGAEASLYKDLGWAGLSWDEGPDIGGPSGPYRQVRKYGEPLGERLAIYRKYAHELLLNGRAYRCFCSREDVAAAQLKSQADTGSTGHYPGTCLALSDAESEERAAKGDAHVIRFRSSRTPLPVPDLIYRGFRKKVAEDDFIIMKTDGFPTYHFANVVDDHLMEVTHVIRGAEWLVSTPMHCDLYSAFGWRAPVFAHVGLLVNTDRSKLSKRNADIQISSYRDQLVLPDALLNFVAYLGWRGPSARRTMTLPELVESFDLRFTKGDIVTDLENMKHYQRTHLNRLLQLDSPRPPRELDSILNFIDRELQSVERLRAEGFGKPPSDASSNARLFGDLASLGALHPAASGSGRGHPADGSEYVYIYRALKMLRNKAYDLGGLLPNNRYLFWRPSRRQLLDTLGSVSSSCGDVSIDGSPSSLHAAIVYIQERLESLGDGHWDNDALANLVAEVNVAITCRERATAQVIPHASYKIWRWIFMGSYPGPSVHSILELLGRQDAVARVEAAAAVAVQPGENKDTIDVEAVEGPSAAVTPVS